MANSSKSTTKKSSSRKKKKTNSKFKLELGFSGVVYLGIFIVLGMVWAFILGGYIGRGYKPEDVVPEIAKIMPETKVRSNRTKSSPGTIATAKQEILKPEQLEFYDNLKTQPEPEPKSKKNISTKHTFKKSPIPKNKKQNPKPATYSYTYQVAAFRVFKQAQVMQKKLALQGIRASIAKGFAGNQTWFRVFAHFHGTTDQLKAFKSKLRKLGIKQPILKRKKTL